ncbi:conserved hypothetical protein [Burkholderiales bacterium 8X]|nr:conserved hypothetical protein [Burkholderiales bacterium 8X]
MSSELEALLAAYTSDFPQKVRDVAETLCAETTHMPHRQTGTSRLKPAELQRTASKHGIEVEMLASAVAAYSQIEERAVASARRGSSLS